MNPGRRPLLLITPGEPAGIGPDLALQIALQIANEPSPAAALLLVADPGLLEARARMLGLSVQIEESTPTAAREPAQAGVVRVWPQPLSADVTAGRLDPANAPYVLNTLAAAADACLAGLADALVTAPVQKSVINDAGVPFSGHTEFLAHRCGGTPVMMLAAGRLRVALATTHLPLRAVPDSLSIAGLLRVLRVLHAELRGRFGIPAPRILVCGLNPHAGEHGHLGREEIEVIEPALRQLRAEGMNLRGPLPADTAFLPAQLDTADAVLAMYHDQGLPVLKHAGFGEAVNVTLGLPIIRTSVDHGTALDLAGSGRADPGSLRAATTLAAQLARQASCA